MTSGKGPSWRWMVLAACILALAWGIYDVTQYRRSIRVEHFAQCLKAKGAKMYGAWWCPHCADQKQEFGRGFEYLNYVECSLPAVRIITEQCKQAGIKRFPTWEFADGSRHEGVLRFEELSQRTGCRWP